MACGNNRKPFVICLTSCLGQVREVHHVHSRLPLNQIKIDTTKPDMINVSLTYVDSKQANKLELSFTSIPKLGKNDPRLITGFVVTTKAHGLSKSSASKTKCDLAISSLTKQAVSGTLSCKAMTDPSAEKPAPDVTAVKFDGKVKAQ